MDDTVSLSIDSSLSGRLESIHNVEIRVIENTDIVINC